MKDFAIPLRVNFPEGQVLYWKYFAINDNEASDINNIVFDTGGAIKKRTGYLTVPNNPIEKVATGTSIAVTGLTYEQLAYKVLEMTPDNERIEYWTVDPSIQGDKQHHKEEKDGEARGESGYDILCSIAGKHFPVMLADNRRNVGWVRVREYLKPHENQWKQCL